MNADKEFIEFEQREIEIASEKIGKVYEIIENKKNQLERIGIDDYIPNIGETLEQVIENIKNQFNDRELSIFAYRKDENIPIVTNMWGNFILLDLYDRVSKAVETINKNSTNEYEQGKRPELGLTKINPITKIFAKIKNLFGNKKFKQDSNYVSKENIDEYIKADKALRKYNLEEDLTGSILRGIEKSKWKSEDEAKDFFKKIIEPDLIKLGLSKKIPELEEKLGVEKENKDKIQTKSRNFVERVDIDFTNVTISNIIESERYKKEHEREQN